MNQTINNTSILDALLNGGHNTIVQRFKSDPNLRMVIQNLEDMSRVVAFTAIATTLFPFAVLLDTRDLVLTLGFFAAAVVLCVFVLTLSYKKQGRKRLIAIHHLQVWLTHHYGITPNHDETSKLFDLIERDSRIEEPYLRIRDKGW